MIISRSFLLRMRNISDKSYRVKTRHLCSITFFENHAVYEIMWKNGVEWAGHRWQYGACALHAEYLRLQDIHSDYVILIAFPLQQLLYECASMLRYTRIACLVFCRIISTGLRLFDGNEKMFPAVHVTLWLFSVIKLWCLVLCPKGVCKVRSSMYTYIGSCEWDLSWYAARYLLIEAWRKSWRRPTGGVHCQQSFEKIRSFVSSLFTN
jgi:hypothetical protein